MAGCESARKSEQTEAGSKHWKTKDSGANKDKKSKNGRTCKGEESASSRVYNIE